jgi:hypothetical protein
MGLATWAGGTEMMHIFEAEGDSRNFIYVPSKVISLEAQYAIDDSSLTVRAEVGDESDDRGQLQFIRFVTVRFQA